MGDDEPGAALLTERSFVQPSFNQAIGPSSIDAVFHDQRLIVELDGLRGHGSERRILRDHRRDLHRRADGFDVVRYHFAQPRTDADLIERELDQPRRSAAVASGG